jgi:hypothetical protein
MTIMMMMMMMIMIIKIIIIIIIIIAPVPAMKAYSGSEEYLHSLLTWAVDTCQWSTLRPSKFLTPGKYAGTRRVKGWEGFKAHLGAFWPRQKTLSPIGIRTSDLLSVT